MADGTKLGNAFVMVAPKIAGNFKAIVEKAMPSGSPGGSKFGGEFSSGMRSAVSAGAVAVGNIVADVVKSGASAAKNLVGEALGGFSDYQQLSGGVAKLYGTTADSAAEYARSVGKSVSDVQAEYDSLKAAQQTVLDNASQAYATAGMSANQYMEQATSFSASLINSLGGDTQKAAELTDVAMRAMSDNVNTFGTDAEAVQNAYQGFSKQNYTMLDNLKLGYGGTKAEMERLLEDASAVSAAHGEMRDFSVDSFADIVEAIQLVQEEQGIAGTTANEAMATVEGSVNMMKASWENWLAALGRDDVDMGQMTSRLVESATYAAQNVVPRLGTIFSSAADALPGLVAGLAPVVGPAVSGLVESTVELAGTLATTTLPQVLPGLVGGATSLVSSLLPEIAAMAPSLAGAGMQLFTGLVQALAQTAPTLTAQLPGLISQVLSSLLANLPALVSASAQLFFGIATGLVQAAPQVLSALMAVLPLLAQEVVSAGPQMLEGGKQLFNAIGQALGEVLPMVADALWYAVTHLPEIVVGGVGGMLDAGGQLLGSLADGIMGKQPEAAQAASDAAAAASAAAEASADGSPAAAKLASTMAASYDFGTVKTAAASGAQAAVDAAVQAADGSKVSASITTKAASSLDTAAVNPQAVSMVNNAMDAAKAVDVSSVGSDFSAKAASGVDVNAMSAKAAQMASSAAGNLNTTSKVSVEADLSGVNALKSAAGTVASSYKTMSSAVSSAMRAASASAVSSASRIRTAINAIPKSKSFSMKFDKPHIPVPHYTISGSLNAKTGSTPTVSAYWAAKGAIFKPNSPGLMGIGDAKVPEVAAPIDKLQEMLGLDDADRGGTTNIYVDGIQASPESVLYRLLEEVVEEAEIATRRRS